ncbi:alcohol dehydrogenase, partial [Bacillus tropicus]|nr:alcohol dehydrogenase [Bacillus tropicus]
IEPIKENEVFFRLLVQPIHPSDLLPLPGAYAHRISLPNLPGYDGVGIVEYVGAGVSIELIVIRVLPLRVEGTLQEYVKSSADFVVPIPDSIGDFTAAQMYIIPLTAWVTCTETINLQRNDVLLFNACGS